MIFTCIDCIRGVPTERCDSFQRLSTTLKLTLEIVNCWANILYKYLYIDYFFFFFFLEILFILG